MMRSRPAFSFIVVAALVLGACSSGDSSNGDPTVPIPTAGTVSSTTGEPDSTPSTESSPASTTSTGRPTSSAPTTTSTTGPPTTLIRPADLVTDPNDPNNLHASLPEHQPIIDAYVAGVYAQLITYSGGRLTRRARNWLLHRSRSESCRRTTTAWSSAPRRIRCSTSPAASRCGRTSSRTMTRPEHSCGTARSMRRSGRTRTRA